MSWIHMATLSILITLSILTMCILLLSGCSKVGIAMRTAESHGTPASAIYIESKNTDRLPHSCSFVEFDGRGDHIDYSQHRGAYNKVRELAKKHEGRLLLVMYCHGWKNNSQSGDVVEFNSFLSQLASTEFVREKKYRVHGIYLGWRGSVVKPFVDKETKFYQSMLKDFNDEPIVDAAWQRRFWITGVAQENLDYYSRRKAAEWKVASVALSRTIFWCATAAKAESEDNFVALLGHSMGALMLEKTVIPACVGNLADNLPWFSSKKIPANPLTFDMILLVNSAAPAIYAKQVRDMFGSYQKALGGSGISHADMPLVYSVTSEADSATGVFHPLGNWFARFSSSLRRTYKERLFAKDVSHPPVRQSSFYVRTPGHHPLLVNHWIRPAREDEIPANSTEKNTLDYNLTLHSPDQAFRTRSDNGSDRFWVLTTIPSNTEKIGGKVKTKWSKYKGVNIVPPKSKYWILRCGPGIIKGHNDIWSNAAIDFYAALFGIAQAEKEMDTR